MGIRNFLPAWYPAACHADNAHWGVPQWIDAISTRGRLVWAEREGKLDAQHLEAVLLGRADPPACPFPVTLLFSADMGHPDAILLEHFTAELESARKQHYPLAGGNICRGVAPHKSKFKLLGFMEGLGRLHRLRVLDWIDLSLWAHLSGVSLEAGYLGDIFWPDEEIDRRYRLVTGTRPLACQLLDQSVIYNLSKVCGNA